MSVAEGLKLELNANSGSGQSYIKIRKNFTESTTIKGTTSNELFNKPQGVIRENSSYYYLSYGQVTTKNLIVFPKQSMTVDGTTGYKAETPLTKVEETVEKPSLPANNWNKISRWVNTLSTNLKPKVGATQMSVYIPTPLLLFHKEFVASFKEDILLKLVMASTFTSFLAYSGISIEQIIGGFIFYFALVIIDAFLAILPGNVKEGTEKDHKLSAKLFMFITNTMAIIGAFAGHNALKYWVSDPNALQTIGVNFHYGVIGWVVGIYVIRITKYVARANKTKIPQSLTNFFNK
ncbi:hypothetical protein [Halalkalibacter krulwichiae]|uniref:Uncharacterized protein n=1 Tax=Halalkalibacter krulwichiae TaxID=199441 RepID=A0A1X9MEI1_9BACI|nr:hypothetical protein [Halalkalibacter krulwichiae]ARK31849.1 hypothetical protein BkAM31D_19530 [Halalkalibacter krulwichiae]